MPVSEDYVSIESVKNSLMKERKVRRELTLGENKRLEN